MHMVDITCYCAILYLVTLMKFQGVLCIYLLLHEGQAECHYAMFSVCEQTNVFKCMLFMIFVCNLSCCMHSYFVLLLELHLSCSCLEFFDTSFECLQMV